MQQSSQEFFCEECGAANSADASHCVACQQPLAHSPASLPAPVRPVIVSPPPAAEVIAQATPPPASSASVDILSPGTLLHKRYAIECAIGQGGYSVVYRARDTRRYGRRVALKQINLRNLTARQVIDATETFNREILLLPTLKHKGIPRYYGHFTDPEHWYLVMEYIKGQTLEDYLQKSTAGGYCSVADTLKIGIALSSILEYLHLRQPRIIFRDVKPSNILLTPRGKIYLIDFGIARSFSPGKARDTTSLGSPGYAAPEQYGRAQSDWRTDVYGLGATLQTLLTGCDPLELRAGEPPRSPSLPPPFVQNLLDSMMDSDPKRRPKTMAVVRRSLQITLARVRWLPLFFLGAGVSALFLLWGAVSLFDTALVATELSSSLGAFSTCLWGIGLFCGLTILLPALLFNPAKRPIALGMLSVVLLVLSLVLFIAMHH